MKKLLIYASFILIPLLLISCSYYQTYSSWDKQFDFTFEYPSSWSVGLIEKDRSVSDFNITAPTVENESRPLVDVLIWSSFSYSPEIEWARNLANIDESNFPLSRRNFHLISHNITSIDEFKGYLVEYTYDGPTSAQVSYWWLPMRVIDIYIPRNNSTYEIYIGASENQWRKWGTDIQHILNTFKWKK